MKVRLFPKKASVVLLLERELSALMAEEHPGKRRVKQLTKQLDLLASHTPAEVMCEFDLDLG